jgi:hypothetical protein
MNIFERVEAALSSITPAVPYGMDTYESTGNLPDQYMAYQVVVSDAEDHADNLEIARSYMVQVSIFSCAGLATLPNVDAAMTAQGFVKGPFRQIPKDALSGHYGLAKDYLYLEFA